MRIRIVIRSTGLCPNGRERTPVRDRVSRAARETPSRLDTFRASSGGQICAGPVERHLANLPHYYHLVRCNPFPIPFHRWRRKEKHALRLIPSVAHLSGVHHAYRGTRATTNAFLSGRLARDSFAGFASRADTDKCPGYYGGGNPRSAAYTLSLERIFHSSNPSDRRDR